MISSEFVTAYNRDAPPPWENRFRDDLKQADDFSEIFGMVLHDRLSGASREPISQDFIMSYAHWQRSGLPTLGDKLERATAEDPTNRDALRSLSQLHFHNLNSGMMITWITLNKDLSEPHPDRIHNLTMAQDIVSLNALAALVFRERAAHPKHNYGIHHSDNRQLKNCIDGTLLESDVAIVLLEMMKQDPALVVVPGPAQFEHSRNSRVNSDFVALDRSDNTAVGIQVASTLSGGPAAARKSDYDKKRVVMIDGDMDIGTRVLRKQATYQSPRLTNWPGMVSAQHFASIPRPRHRQHQPSVYSLLGEREVVKQKLAARQILGSRAVKLAPIVTRISQRVVHGLRSEAA